MGNALIIGISVGVACCALGLGLLFYFGKEKGILIGISILIVVLSAGAAWLTYDLLDSSSGDDPGPRSGSRSRSGSRTILQLYIYWMCSERPGIYVTGHL